MPRDKTDYLHDATKATFEHNVGAVARGWNKSERIIYRILAEEAPDHFPAFLEQYIGVLKGGVSSHEYDNELEYARHRYGRKPEYRSETECFTRHTEAHSQTMVMFIKALQDGNLTLEEIASIEKCLNAEERNLEMIRVMLNFKKANLEDGIK